MNLKERRKKDRERLHLDSFIKAMRLPWTIVRPGNDQGEPDFFVQTQEGLTGVELTQLFVDRKAGMTASPGKEAEMRRARKLLRLADEYYQLTDVPVYAQFTRFDEDMLSLTATQIADVVAGLATMEEKKFELSDTVAVRLLRLPAEMQGYRHWQVTLDRVGWVTKVQDPALEAVISPKRQKLEAYRRSAIRVVLLIVVDRTWPSGMIKNADELAAERQGFDAIYLHVLPDVARRLDAVRSSPG